MRVDRRISIVVAAVALFAAACGGGSAAGGGGGGGGSSSGPLTIGVINPFSGPNAPGGVAIYQGYQVAVDAANANGGVLGRKVRLVKGDASSPQQGISEVNRLATSENVDVFAGTYISAVSETASKTALRYNKLYWDTNALAASLTKRNLKNFVRSGPSATQFARRSVDVIKDLVAPELHKKIADLSVYISHENSIYGTSIANLQKKELTAAGATVVGNVGYPADSSDLTSTIVRGQQHHPDVWLQTGYVPDSNLLLRTARQQHFQPKARVLVGTGDTDETLHSLGAKSLDGTLVVAYPHTDISSSYGPGADKFLAAFKDKFGGPPDFPQSMTAYVGMRMLLNAVDKAGSTDPSAVRKAISNIDKPEGSFATGYGEKFNENFQNTLALPVAVQWQSGKTVTVYPKEAKPNGAKLISLG